MKLLKSIEELLYELVTWFLFYPLTLWRIVVHPQRMLSYAEEELGGPAGSQFDDAVSPPILLLLTLVILHGSAGLINPLSTTILPGFLGDDRNLLVFRTVAFSLLPLLFALLQVRLRAARTTRSILKPAFYSQSFAAVPFVMGFSIGLNLMLVHSSVSLLGAAIVCTATIWFLGVETIWLSHSANRSRISSFATALGTLLIALVLILLASWVVEISAAGQDGTTVPA